MEDKVSLLKEIIAGILGIDDSKRKICEQKLEEMKSQPDSLVLSLLKLIQTCPNPDHRKLSATLLKRFVSVMTNAKDCVWKTLSKETQIYLKEQILLAIATEQDQRVAKLVSLVIAEISGTVQDADQEWPELDVFIHKMVTGQTSDLQKEMGYLVMNYVFAYVQERYEKHGSELADSFCHDSNSRKISS